MNQPPPDFGNDEISSAMKRAFVPPLRWSSEPPKVPGWYWHYPHGSRMHGIIFVSSSHIKAVEFFPKDKWAGPIPEPEG